MWELCSYVCWLSWQYHHTTSVMYAMFTDFHNQLVKLSTVVSEIFARCKFRESLDLGLFAFLFSRMASLFCCKHPRELLHYNSRRNGTVLS